MKRKERTLAGIVVDGDSTGGNLLVLLGVWDITESYAGGELISDFEAGHFALRWLLGM